jgi:hypothetical protein
LNPQILVVCRKKIGDIPEERRHRLLDLLEPKHISSMWKLSGLRYDFPDLLVEDAAGLLPNKAIEKPLKPIIWSGQVNEGERHLNQHLFLLEM